MTQIDQIYPGVAMVVFNQKGEVLLQKRADIDKWGLLSDHVEPGETVENAAIREVREEAALTVKVKKLIGVYSDPNFRLFHYPTGKCVHFITNCFLMEITGGSLLNNSNESLALKFFNLEHLPENLLKMGPLWLHDALSDQDQAFIR